MRWQLGFGCISLWTRIDPVKRRLRYYGIQDATGRFLLLHGSLHRTHGFKVSDPGANYKTIVRALEASGWTMKLNKPEQHAKYVTQS